MLRYVNGNQQLKTFREHLGISQIELDARAGIREGTTFDLESGRNKRPAHETVVRIVRAFHRSGMRGVTTDQIFHVPDGEAIAS
jgi:predicted transcriptional regulator